MQIKLKGHYRNASVSIAEGIYEESDPRLHGLAKYLLETEQAESVELHEVIVQVATPIAKAGNELISRDSSASHEAPEAEDTLSLSELRARYKTLAGKGASPKWDADTLSAKIAEIESAESDNA